MSGACPHWPACGCGTQSGPHTCEWEHRDSLSMWVLYDHPRDYPDEFVARLWLVAAGGVLVATDDTHTAGTLDGLRAKLPRGLACVTRRPDDDPKVIEVWL